MSKKDDTPKKIIYYHDELNDEFSTAVITPKKIDGDYLYERTHGWRRLLHIFWYRLVAIPLAFLYLKFTFGHKIVGREKIKSAKKQACFVYGNHTQAIADAFIPTFVRYPGSASVIVHPNNVSMPFLGRINPYLGAIPLPDDLKASRNFIKIIEQRVNEKKAVFIYPEAHIWPYYTGIRPFGEASFLYPVKYGTPVFCFTNTYRKRKRRKTPRIVTYVDGPFYPDENIAPRDRRTVLRNTVYETMTERSKLSDVKMVEYIKAEEKQENPGDRTV